MNVLQGTAALQQAADGFQTGCFLVLEPETGLLKAFFRPAAGVSPPDDEVLGELVAAHGWSLEALDGAGVSSFLDRCRIAARAAAEATETGEPAEPGEVDGVVGVVQDGAWELTVEPDNMAVYLSLTPPRGGRPVALADVQAALAARHVVRGVDEARLAELVASGQCTHARIAEGRLPTQGEPARFESLLHERREESRPADESARVDYRDLGTLLLVRPGDALMRRIPARQGEDGYNVLGERLAAAQIVDQPFARALPGAQVDPQDPDVLRAAIAGVPAERRHGVTVNPMVQLEAVDLNSGNIDFDGTLQVKGDITAGMKVRVKGDVVVHGTIEAASLDVGGNVVVKGGIIGTAPTSGSADDDVVWSAHITCGGSVQARFINNAAVNAGTSIKVEREIRNSEVSAGESVVVGSPEAGQGNIVGGVCRAGNLVQVASLGAMSGVPTVVHVGVNPLADAQKAALARERRRIEEEKTKLEQLLTFLQANPQKNVNGLADRARATHAALMGELAAVQQDERKLADELATLDGAMVHVTKRFWDGVTVRIGHRQHVFQSDQVGGKAVLEGEEIVIR